MTRCVHAAQRGAPMRCRQPAPSESDGATDAPKVSADILDDFGGMGEEADVPRVLQELEPGAGDLLRLQRVDQRIEALHGGAQRGPDLARLDRADGQIRREAARGGQGGLVALVGVVVNVALKIALFRPLGAPGLALATAAGLWIKVAGVFVLAWRRGWSAPDARLVATFAVAIASFHVVEMPIRRGALRRSREMRIEVILITAVVLVAAFFQSTAAALPATLVDQPAALAFFPGDAPRLATAPPGPPVRVLFVGDVIGRLQVAPERPDDDVIDHDLILVWGPQRRIINGADLLGRLLRDIVTLDGVTTTPQMKDAAAVVVEVTRPPSAPQ